MAIWRRPSYRPDVSRAILNKRSCDCRLIIGVHPTLDRKVPVYAVDKAPSHVPTTIAATDRPGNSPNSGPKNPIGSVPTCRAMDHHMKELTVEGGRLFLRECGRFPGLRCPSSARTIPPPGS